MSEIISSLVGVHIESSRASGNTTRIINNVVELLFQGKEVMLLDHSGISNGNRDLIRRVKERLLSEFNLRENIEYSITNSIPPRIKLSSQTLKKLKL